MRGYRAGRAFDGDRTMPGGALVLVEDGVIVGVEPAAAPVPDGIDVTDLPGGTLLPGLIDAHVHLCGDSGPRALDQLPELSDQQQDAIIEAAMKVHFGIGVTAVRDLGDRDFAVVDRHRNRPEGLTVVASGPPITSVAGHCANMGGEAAGIEGLRQAVRDRAEHGADLVKIMTSGGIMTATTDVLACQFTLAEVRAVVEEAHRLGLPVAAHAHATSAVELSVAAGVDTIEHCSCMSVGTLAVPPGLGEAMTAAGIVVCPTLGTHPSFGTPPPAIQAMMDRLGLSWDMRAAQIAELIAAGVTLISGGDSGINAAKPHGVLPYSLIQLADCGLSTEAVLASATGVAATACGLAGRTGRLRAGLDADLLMVDADPLADMAAIQAVHTVVSRGREVVTAATR